LDNAAIARRSSKIGAIQLLERKEMNTLPLFGIPFAIKDNIDVKDLLTTTACPTFSYIPTCHAFFVLERVVEIVVERLLAAGAILIGKTNLNRFATGLVGIRSPYGVVRNSFNPKFISGGYGSAIAVATGLLSFAFDTPILTKGLVSL
jgi:allophanate hydrolase